jgi:membrane protease YdiL (CAAX protease family)
MTADSRSRVLALAEVAAVMVAGFAIRALMRQLGAGVASGSLSIVVLLTLTTWLLRRRGLGWRELGVRRPADLGIAAAWTAGLLMVDLLLVPALTALVGDSLGWPRQQLDAFAGLRGNLMRFLVLLIPISWGSAAFGEELIFRGFLARRIADVFGATPRADLLANLAQAGLFALGHAYLGPRGMLNAGALGLAAGLVYRGNGRNLWPLFFAHGLVDTIGISVLYSGVPHS